MPHLEPTYLRYIYDSLIEGSIHPENAAELPDGLIGLYEDAFNERNAVFERQKLLKRFAIWALLKKEVSAAFVAEVLSEPEADILNFISTYSAWFNSPESGKYELYHERLKLYLLQKMSEREVSALHEKLIVRLEKAIDEQKADEFELYGLEFLAGHFGVAAILNGDGEKIIEIACSQTHWQRQLKISKGYTWTKNGLKALMSWASKYNDDEVIDCGLQMVDLHHKEQNAAPQIVALVAEGDFDAALKRIEQFGGNDKEGLQRKFILYMLCLMELTLLESKNKPYRKEGIEKLLKHLNEKLPVDHSVLNWNYYFPSYIAILLAFEWAALELDYAILFKRADAWEKDWLEKNDAFSDHQFEILKGCANCIKEVPEKSVILTIISAKLAKQEKKEAAASTLLEALECAQSIPDNNQRIVVLAVISTELHEQGKIEHATSVMGAALECACRINDKPFKSSTLSTELAKQGKIEGAFNYARSIENETMRSSAIAAISTELAKQGQFEQAASTMLEAFEYACGITSEIAKSSALLDISTELAKQGKIEEAVTCTHDISLASSKSSAKSTISLILAQKFKIEEALECARGILDELYKSYALLSIATELAKREKIEEAASTMQEAIECARGIKIDWQRRSAFKDISTELGRQGKIEKVEFLMQEDLALAFGKSYDSGKNFGFAAISLELAKNGLSKEALECVRIISNETMNSSAMAALSTELEKQGKKDESKAIMIETIDRAFSISSEIRRSKVIGAISIELAKQGNISQSLECIQGISLNSSKNIALAALSTEMALQGKIEEALDCARSIISDKWKVFALKDMSSVLNKHGLLDQASTNIHEALNFARSISDESEKSHALLSIATELAKQGKIEEALDITKGISHKTNKSHAYATISTEILKKGNYDECELTIQKALSCAQSISDANLRSIALAVLSCELAEQENWSNALNIGLEIPQSAVRHKCWKELVKVSIKQIGPYKSLLSYKTFNNAEARSYYLKGWVENLESVSASQELAIMAIRILMEDIESIEHLLQLHALNQLFFEDIPEEKIQRFNRTLNIQWAIDIKNQLPN